MNISEEADREWREDASCDTDLGSSFYFSTPTEGFQSRAPLSDETQAFSRILGPFCCFCRNRNKYRRFAHMQIWSSLSLSLFGNAAYNMYRHKSTYAFNMVKDADVKVRDFDP